MSEATLSPPLAKGHAPLRESAELVMVRDAARALLDTEWPSAQAAALAQQPDELRRLWRHAVQQGWTQLELDDAELGLAAALVLQQELGRAECPLPLMDSLLADAVLAASSQAEAASLRAALHEGNLIPTWCLEPTGQPLGTRLPFVEHTAFATHLFILTGAADEVLVVPMSTARVQATPGMARPPLAEVSLDGAQGVERIHTGAEVQALPGLARLLLAARALGAAQHGLQLLCDYARVRQQFGQLIGQFQAIQHKLANCLMGTEVCRLALLHAVDGGDLAARPYRAATAVALAGQYLRPVVLELMHGFGGVSFWEEHEMPRIFRRVHADVTRLGGVGAAREQLAEQLLKPGARIPEFDLGERANTFRREVRDWLAEHWDHQYPPDTANLPVNHRKAR